MSAYIPLSNWSKDHWSTLAYAEHVMMECAGFQLGADPRMKSNRRNFRVMAEGCPRPARPGRGGLGGQPMRPEHATRLKDGTQPEGHDDWMCLQDMAQEGFFTVGVEGVEPGETLHLSEKGRQIADALRLHKANGGQFATFDYPLPSALGAAQLIKDAS